MAGKESAGVGHGLLDRRANLSGKTAVVIGGAGGIGERITRDLAESGVDVAFCDMDEDRLEAMRDAIAATGRLRLAQVGDARNAEEIHAFFAAFDEVSDRLDILVNVAGGTRLKLFADSTPETWDADARWNYTYALHTIKHATERMRRSGGGGSIVNITTIEAHRGAPGYSVYAGYKAALTNFSSSLAFELGHDGIRINCVAVENIPTPGTARIRDVPWKDPSRGDELWLEGFKMYVPLKRRGSAEEVSSTVLFLASDLSSFITGSAIHVDGGTYAAPGWMYWPEDGWIFPRPSPATLERLFPGPAET
jgi:NAD(P)-dependent dehydrogenase (short-subunit alcohol dehydrogenase family)